jgi:glyoxylase-like metal-dependent hydrolase (beta-lactamase superfamily II)
MTAYLASLARVRALGARVLLPAHGLPSRAVARLVDQYVRHRTWREARILAQLGPGALTADELLARAYSDTPPAQRPLARHSLEAHLLKLAAEGRAREVGPGRWTVG